MLNYSAAFPPLTASDVASREVTLTVGSDPAGVSSYPPTEVSFPFSAPDNAVVTLSLVDIDDAGNRSEAAVTTFTATDTIPPPMPGALAVTLVSES